MKKLITMLAIGLALVSTNASAQGQNGGGGDPAARMARMKEMTKPGLMEKAKITDAQADKVIELQFESRQQMRGFRDMAEDERKKKSDEIKTGLDKKYKEMSLTDEQIKAVNDYFDEMRRNMQQRQGGGGN